MSAERPPEALLRDSPVDFDTAVAYALHPEMRRLVILYIVGVLVLPYGMGLFLGPTPGGLITVPILERVVGLLLAIVGAVLLFGGLIGAVFKLVTDANRLARAG